MVLFWVDGWSWLLDVGAYGNEALDSYVAVYGSIRKGIVTHDILCSTSLDAVLSGVGYERAGVQYQSAA